MYISEITIDGFKSYAKRITLPNWDEQFNAITGLNGTGKSNILDSICFVLGITNLQQIRAGSLQELVYKQGNAGITKATVSITFHNNDPKTSPAGYEDKEYITVTRQVVIGGRNKYLINGHAAQPTRVQDFFHSVQLNVNNPHFLIMQGRITKVLNMKPPEILSLLEEASGTRLYEKKKESALGVLNKKQKKLAEIDQVIDEELRPALQKFEQQCSQYHEYAVLSQRVEQLKRFCVAVEHVRLEGALRQGAVDLAHLAEEVTSFGERRAAVEEEIADRVSGVRALVAEKEIRAGGEAKEVQQQADELAMRLTRETTSCKNKKETLDGEQASLKQMQASLEELDAAELERRVVDATSARDAAREALTSGEHAVEAASRELAGAEAGDGRDESNRSLQERLADAQKAQTAADADAKAADIRAKHCAKQAAAQAKALVAKEKEAAGLRRELEGAQKGVADCQAKLQALRFDESAMQQLEAKQKSGEALVRSCKEKVEAVAANLGGLDFTYSDPCPGFDRSRVKGPIAKLLRVKDPATSLALEVAAGGRLYQVVVDTEATAKLVLAKGNLRKRSTLVPLNQVASGQLSAAVKAAAHRLSGGKARPALDLIDFDPELAPAMAYAFGNVLICEDGATAKKLAYHREVSVRCITLEGDDMNPGGTLTGGSRNASASILTRLHALREAEAELAGHREDAQQAAAQLRGMAAAAKEFRRLQQQLELQQHALSLMQGRFQESESAQLAAALGATQAELAAAQEALTAAQDKKAELVELAKSLQRDITNFSRDRGQLIKAAQDKLKKAKQQVEGAKKLLKQREQELQAALAERDAGSAERSKLEEQAAAAAQLVQQLSAELAELQAAAAATRAEREAAAARLEAMRARLRDCDAEIAQVEGERDALKQQLQNMDADKRKLENRLGARRNELNSSKESLAALERDYEWIAREKVNFGRGDFDFSKHDAAKVLKEYQLAEAKLQTLKDKKISSSVEAMFKKTQSDVDSLTTKRKQVEKDRLQIEAVIEELDSQKRIAMEATWQQVNKTFGSIFSTLLPGTSAKLDPPEGLTFLDGLEVRVAFGTVWKESLTELSGGQRSLLALSLILALCRFKPAPLYILDEVDAALDLNHTQNIGRMIKEHFPESQFIVVSLKEGMFNNANVIFRTKFVEGVSAVTRTVPEAAGRENRGAGGKTPAARGDRNRQALRENVRA